MKIELKNVKVANWASEETLCYRAVVYVDGKRAFTAENDGHGGCDMYHPVPGADRALIEQAEAYVKTLPKVGGTACCGAYTEVCQDDGQTVCKACKADARPWDDPMERTLEIHIGELLEEWQTVRELKRHLRTKILIAVDSGKTGSIKVVAFGKKKLKGRDRATDEELIGVARKFLLPRYPDGQLMNDLSIEEALKLWKRTA